MTARSCEWVETKDNESIYDFFKKYPSTIEQLEFLPSALSSMKSKINRCVTFSTFAFWRKVELCPSMIHATKRMLCCKHGLKLETRHVQFTCGYLSEYIFGLAYLYSEEETTIDLTPDMR